MRDAVAVTTSGDVGVWLVLTIVLYVTLAVALVLILRRMATGGPPEPPAAREEPVEPTEPLEPSVPAVSAGGAR
jgi:cytochrome d ubiquinol oxidase subunit I